VISSPPLSGSKRAPVIGALKRAIFLPSDLLIYFPLIAPHSLCRFAYLPRFLSPQILDIPVISLVICLLIPAPFTSESEETLLISVKQDRLTKLTVCILSWQQVPYRASMNDASPVQWHRDPRVARDRPHGRGGRSSVHRAVVYRLCENHSKSERKKKDTRRIS
jgi:hypothetical protein